MGYVPLTHLREAYIRIRSEASASGTSVLIFVAADTDSLCALKILLKLLKSDCIPYLVAPVFGLDELTRATVKHVANNNELRSIFMLNCGGILDLEEFFDLGEQAAVYVIDSHRPLHLRNLFGGDRIIVFDDGEADSMKGVQEAFQELEFPEASDDDVDDDGGGRDDVDPGDEENIDPNDDDPGHTTGAKRKTGDGDGDDDGDGNGGDGAGLHESNAASVQLSPRSRRRRRIAQRRKRRRDHQAIITEYYTAGTYYGTSASSLLYTLATQVGNVNAEMLWLSIIGLTDQYLHERIDSSRYRNEATVMKDETVRFDFDGRGRDAAGDGGADDQLFGEDDPENSMLEALLADDDAGDRFSDAGGANPARQRRLLGGTRMNLRGKPAGLNGVRHANDKAVRCVDEFRLMLLRHWTLYESLYHSSYVATRLGVWKEKGRQRLTNLLVKMGFPHKECQQLYSEMHTTLKRDMKRKLPALGPAFNLPDLVFPSFARHFGYKVTVGASDVVHSVSSLLDCGADWMRRQAGGEDVENAASWFLASGTDNGGTGIGRGAHIGGAGAVSRVAVSTSNASGFGAGASVLSGVGMGTRQGTSAVRVITSEFDKFDSRKKSNVRTLAGEQPEEAAPPSDDESEDEDEDEENAEEARAWRRRRRAREKELIKNFYLAFDALDDVDLLLHGIHLGMHFQRALVRAGITILDRQITKALKAFRLTVLAGVSADPNGNRGGQVGVSNLVGDREFMIFGRSVALLGRLASFLMEAYREHRKKGMPMVIAAYNDETDAYLVLGKPEAKRHGDVRKNYDSKQKLTRTISVRRLANIRENIDRFIVSNFFLKKSLPRSLFIAATLSPSTLGSITQDTIASRRLVHAKGPLPTKSSSSEITSYKLQLTSMPYVASEPFDFGHLAVSSLHSIYYEQSGNPQGKPVVFIHGGPGGGCSPSDRTYFDPGVYRVVLFDQRGAGKSTPAAELKENDTWSLVADIEKLREFLKIDRWLVFGGSWGSTLALTYAIKHPDRVKGLVLRGIFTLRKAELHWFYQEGASFIFPDAWEGYLAPIPEEERGNLIEAYYKRLTGESEEVRRACGKAWSKWEMQTSRLQVDDAMLARAENDIWADQFARIECHYFINNGFFEKDGWILDNIQSIRHIPCVVVQGRYDVVCPMYSAWDLHRRWPEAKLHIIPNAGHSAKEEGTTLKLVEACDEFKTL
ncbi:hypothetical protein HDU96_003039 [Phlyctochytrium bullatum]|nr:hypothetical protein HDU96_003039 [Phlyctochytrium bullatum]